jgi:hypothetical protein
LSFVDCCSTNLINLLRGVSVRQLARLQSPVPQPGRSFPAAGALLDDGVAVRTVRFGFLEIPADGGRELPKSLAAAHIPVPSLGVSFRLEMRWGGRGGDVNDKASRR